MSANRQVDVAIRYILSTVGNGIKQALAQTEALDKTTKQTTATVEKAAGIQQKQWEQVAKIAERSETRVAVAAIKTTTVVNTELDKIIAKNRELGLSYDAIIVKQRQAGVSAGEMASAMQRSAAKEIEAMQRVRAEASRPVTQRVRELGGRARAGFGGAVAGPLGLLGGVALGGIGGAGAVAYSSYRKASGVTEDAYRLQGQTGMSQAQAMQLAIIAQSQHDLPTRTLGMSLATLSHQEQAALQAQRIGKGNPSTLAFNQLGITTQQATGLHNNIPGLVDLVHQRLAGLHNQTLQASLSRQFFGRGASQLGPLFKEGPLVKHMDDIKRQTGGLSPADLQKINVEVVKLNEQITIFELKFIKAFGPEIRGALHLMAKAVGPVGAAFTAAFKWVEGVARGPVGQALAAFGKQVAAAGKQFVEAFAPAVPFFKNVLLPLIEGFAVGVATGIIATIKVATAVVRLFAPVLGSIGDALKPLKPVIMDVGKVLGFVFGPGALGKIADGFKAVGGELPLVGRAVSAMGTPIRVVGQLFGRFFDVVAGIFSKLPYVASGAVKAVIAALAALPNKLLSVGSAVLAAITSAFSSVWTSISQIGQKIVSSIVDGIKAAPSAIVDALTGLLPGPLKGAASSIKGSASSALNTIISAVSFNQGGMVGAMVSPGEQIIHQGRAMTVPGPKTAADSVFMHLPVGSAVLTGHGQQLMAHGASMHEAIASQLPHFAAGTPFVLPATGGRGGGRGHSGPKPRMRYFHHHPVGVMDEAQWQAYQLGHSKSTQGLTVTGKVSTFGPPAEKGQSTAYGGQSSSAGIALNPDGTGGSGGWNGKLAVSLAGKLFDVSVGAHHAVLKVIDKGPFFHGRKIDITGAGAQLMGLDPKNFPTDQVGRAVQVIGGVAGRTLAAKTPNLSVSELTGSPLTVDDAFQTAYEAGLKGDSFGSTSIVSDAIKSAAVQLKAQTSPGGLTGDSGVLGGQASATAGGALGRMAQSAAQIASRHYSYAWGGGHNASFSPTAGSGHGSGPGVGYDCSGAVSKVLHDGGALGGSPLTSGGLMSWGQSGKGKQVSVFAGPAHTFMQIAGRYFGTSTQNSGGGAGWLRSFPENLSATRHPPGMRAGGLVGVGSYLKSAYPAAGLNIAPALGTLTGAATSDVSGRIGQTLQSIGDMVSSATALQLQRTALLVSRALARARDPIVARRLQGALAIVQGVVANRLGLLVKSVQDTVAGLAGLDTLRTRGLRASGVSTTSSVGLQSEQAFSTVQQGVLAGAARQIAELTRAAKRANAPKAVLDDLKQKLADINDQIAEGVAHTAELARQIVTQAAADYLQSATHQVNTAAGAVDQLTASQRVAGTAGTPEALTALAQATAAQLAPMRDQLAALQGTAYAAGRTGDLPALIAAQEQIQKLQTDIIGKQADAADLLKAAAQAQHDAATAAAQGATSLDQSRFQALTISQQLAGTDQTGGGQRADFIRSTIIPDLQRELAPIISQLAADQGRSDAAAALRDMIDLQNKQNEIASANLQANKETAQNTQPLKDASGSLGFQYHGELQSDLAGIGTGA